MRHTVCGQMKLAPHSASVSPMLPDFPFAFPEDLQASRIDNQMRDFTPGWRLYANVNALCTFADQRVVRAT